ncbi:hypothetical protein E2C01_088990 [Portunus trituberculatus]|uniref:Uncharacterized protein n=1 Tax=Portunus trituberculatus TaxID=210409 RepID=A0A5B7JGX9_PORTR|nr:hypothetical protein [Portunus trituberculatus]
MSPWPPQASASQPAADPQAVRPLTAHKCSVNKTHSCISSTVGAPSCLALSRLAPSRSAPPWPALPGGKNHFSAAQRLEEIKGTSVIYRGAPRCPLNTPGSSHPLNPILTSPSLSFTLGLHHLYLHISIHLHYE